MVCAPVRSIVPSLKLGDYLSAQAHKPCSISHMYNYRMASVSFVLSMPVYQPVYAFTFVFTRPKMKIVYIVPSEDRLQKLR